MIEDIPILEIDLKILKYCGILLGNNWRCYVVILPFCLLNVLKIVYLYQNDEDFSNNLVDLYFLIAIFIGLLRNLGLILNRKKVEKFLLEFGDLHNNVKMNGSESVKNYLNTITVNVRRISIFNLTAGFLDLTAAVLLPILARKRIHPFAVAFPFFDVMQSPYYEIIYLMELTIPVLMTILYMPFVNLFVSIAMFCVVILKDVQYKFNHLCDSNATEMETIAKLVHCIRYHNRIISFVKKFNAVVTYIVFGEFLLNVFILCLLLFWLIVANSVGEKIVVGMYICTLFYVLLIYYWQANKLSDESLKVCDAIYDMEWYNCSPKIKKIIVITMMRSQKPLEIMIGNIYPITLNAFQSLVNAAYTYFTVLRNVTNK